MQLVKRWTDLDGESLPGPFTPKGERPTGPARYATPTGAIIPAHNVVTK